MDTSEIVAIVLALIFGALTLTYGGYSVKAKYPFGAILSYVAAGACVAAAIIIPIITAIYGLPSREKPTAATPARVAAMPEIEASQSPSPLVLQNPRELPSAQTTPEIREQPIATFTTESVVKTMRRYTEIQRESLYAHRWLKISGSVSEVFLDNENEPTVIFYYGGSNFFPIWMRFPPFGKNEL